MRNTYFNFRIKLILVSAIFFLAAARPTTAQQYLAVPLLGQEETNWCWAASIQMVTDFHTGSGETQCKLAALYRYFDELSFDPNASLADFDCCADCGTDDWDCNQQLPHSAREGFVDLAYFDLILSELGYHSMEDIRTDQIDWAAVQNEINACRPFLIMLNRPISSTSFSHTVVAKGYNEIGTNRMLLINDPLPVSGAPCAGGWSYVQNVAILSDPPLSNYAAMSVVTGIKPKGQDPCEPCRNLIPAEEDPIITAIRKHKLFDFNKELYPDDQIQELLKKQDAQGKAYFASNRYYYESLQGKRSDEHLALLSQEDGLLITLTPDKKGNWMINQVGFNKETGYQAAIDLRLKGDTSPREYDYTKFRIVEFLPENFRFYEVKTDHGLVYTPMAKYPNLSFEPGLAYSKRAIVRALKKRERKQRRKQVYHTKEKLKRLRKQR